MANLNAEQLRRLARLGAMARLTQIREEEAAIRGEFPELFGRGMEGQAPARGGRQGTMRTEAAEPSRNGEARRGRRKMSAAARRAVSIRMRKYWAERRKSKGTK